jgi:hypothetical protein
MTIAEALRKVGNIFSPKQAYASSSTYNPPVPTPGPTPTPPRSGGSNASQSNYLQSPIPTPTGSSGGYYSGASPIPTPTGGVYASTGQAGSNSGSSSASQSNQNMGDIYGEQRSSAEEQARRALEAAMGVFNTKAQNLRNQIPGLEAARDLRVRGLEEGLSQFNDTAAREEASRLAKIQQNEQATQEAYLTGERKTRASAKALANRLRNIFQGTGTLDSTQYKDMNIDQSKEILQSLGDIRREGAGKLALSRQEQDDLTKYYAEQKNQFAQKTALAKDNARAETDAQIRGVMGDINLTDAQRVEAVTEAQNKLEQRLSSITEAERSFAQQQQKDAQELATKLTELKSKGTSTAYSESLKAQKALTSAVDVVNKIAGDMPGSNKADIAKQVFASYPELKDIDPVALFGRSYTTGGDNTDQQLGALYGAQ